jgi:hypothetical protein
METFTPIPGETKFNNECRARGSLTLPRANWRANSTRASYLPDRVREAKAALEEAAHKAYLAGCEACTGTTSAAAADKIVAAYFKSVEADAALAFPLSDDELDEIIAKREADATEAAVCYLIDGREHVGNMLDARRAKNRKKWDQPANPSNAVDPRLAALDDLIAECQFGPPREYVFVTFEYQKLGRRENATDVNGQLHDWAELDGALRSGRAKIRVVSSPPAREWGIAGLVEP